MDELQQVVDHDAVGAFKKEMNHFAVALSAAVDSTQPAISSSAVAEALAFVNRLENAGFREAVSNSTVWRHASCSAAGLVQATSQDVLGDGKLARASQILEDPRLPRLAENPDSQEASRTKIVENAKLAVDGSALEALEESLSALTEAKNLWSQSRCEQQASAVKVWATTIVASVAGLNELQWLCLDGVLKGVNALEEELSELCLTDLAQALNGATGEICGATSSIHACLPERRGRCGVLQHHREQIEGRGVAQHCRLGHRGPHRLKALQRFFTAARRRLAAPAAARLRQ